MMSWASAPAVISAVVASGGIRCSVPSSCRVRRCSRARALVSWACRMRCVSYVRRIGELGCAAASSWAATFCTWLAASLRSAINASRKRAG